MSFVAEVVAFLCEIQKYKNQYIRNYNYPTPNIIWVIKKMDGARNTYKEEERYIESFGWET
jgi:hypothetical protein